MTGLSVALVHNHLTWGDAHSGKLDTFKRDFAIRVSAAVAVPFLSLIDAFCSYVAAAACTAVILARRAVQVVSSKTDFLQQATVGKARELFANGIVYSFILFPSGLQGLVDPELQNDLIEKYLQRNAAKPRKEVEGEPNFGPEGAGGPTSPGEKGERKDKAA